MAVLAGADPGDRRSLLPQPALSPADQVQIGAFRPQLLTEDRAEPAEPFRRRVPPPVANAKECDRGRLAHRDEPHEHLV